MMEIEHDIAALHAHEKMSRNAVADGEAVLHAEAVEQAEEEAAHEATEADESLLNKQLEIEYADQTEITNIEAEINADKSFIATLQKHIDASTSLSGAEKAQLDAELKAEEADLARLEEQLSTEQAKVSFCSLCFAETLQPAVRQPCPERYGVPSLSLLSPVFFCPACDRCAGVGGCD
jgi:hypothetical protein